MWHQWSTPGAIHKFQALVALFEKSQKTSNTITTKNQMAAARGFRRASGGSIATALFLAMWASQALLSAVAFVTTSSTGNGGRATAAALRGRAVVIDSVRMPKEQRAPGVEDSIGTTRRSGLALLAVLGSALTAASRAEAKKKNPLDDDYSDFKSSKLDGMMKKDFGKAQDETKCKPAAEGEKRAFCITREINEMNRKAAEAKGEKYVDQKGTLSKGSYGV